MAATLSSFIPPIFRQNQTSHHPNPRGAIVEDFSYSYSALPVSYRSENKHYDAKKPQNGAENAQRKYLANILNKQEHQDDRHAKTLPRNIKYDEKNSNVVKKHYELETTCTNLPYKTDENKNYDGRTKDDLAVATSVWRLRNSIFSSLKLPKKISPSKMSSVQGGTLGFRTSGMNQSQHKRKSAVELLQESKAFYVKSETVLDRKQELPLRTVNTINSSTSAHYATLSGRHRRGGGEALQSQLRRLLGSTSTQSPSLNDSRKTNTYKDSRNLRDIGWDTPPQHTTATPTTNRSHYNSSTFSGNSSSGTSGSKSQVKSDPEHLRISNPGNYSTKSLNRPSSSGDNRIFFPDTFVVPKPSKSDPSNVFANSFSIGSPFSSPEKIDARKILSVVDAYDTEYGLPDSKIDYYDDGDLMMDYSTISPPAEYAITEKSNYRYVRSNSHSHTIKPRPEPNPININSHKSLPDLHKQADHYSQDGQFSVGSTGYYLSGYDGSRHSGMALRPDHAIRSTEALSSYSKATSGRSNKSSVFSSKGSDSHSRRSASCHNSDPSYTGRGSADEVYYYNRSGSSYARDSGGSSGHCSGMGPPSLPPVQNQIQQRRDSGSSTQHSSSRSHRYPYYDGYQESTQVEYHVSAPIQFQDGVDSSHHLSVNATLSICAPAGTPGSRSLQSQPSGQGVPRVPTVGIHFQASIPPVQFQDPRPYKYDPPFGAEGFYGRRESGVRESRHLMQRPASSGYTQNNRYARDHEREEGEDPETSPPGLGNFKRQRCLRYKQRRPILRSKSDISDRYWRNENGTILSITDKQSSPISSDNDSPDRNALHQLNKFFDQLGFDDATFKEVVLDTLKKPSRKKTDGQNNHLPAVRQSPNHDLQQGGNANCNIPKPYADEDAESSESLEFSELSDADSNLIINNGDYTVQGLTPKPDPRLYRSCEPPSIVERNARIIKWLCNCRKLQAM